ncbi:MAG: hypothetical protein JHC93_02920 [Parachlamydiales bacterium]|nr:hypothetical protein [Parachlamydiales bacterium]
MSYPQVIKHQWPPSYYQDYNPIDTLKNNTNFLDESHGSSFSKTNKISAEFLHLLKEKSSTQRTEYNISNLNGSTEKAIKNHDNTDSKILNIKETIFDDTNSSNNDQITSEGLMVENAQNLEANLDSTICRLRRRSYEITVEMDKFNNANSFIPINRNKINVEISNLLKERSKSNTNYLVKSSENASESYGNTDSKILSKKEKILNHTNLSNDKKLTSVQLLNEKSQNLDGSLDYSICKLRRMSSELTVDTETSNHDELTSQQFLLEKSRIKNFVSEQKKETSENSLTLSDLNLQMLINSTSELANSNEKFNPVIYTPDENFLNNSANVLEKPNPPSNSWNFFSFLNPLSS